MRVDFNSLGIKEYAICANLPYNVGTELLLNWLHIAYEQIRNHKSETIKSMTLMFQREVAQRIVATPGDKQYGRLSVLTSLVSDAKILFGVPSTAFVPRPKVESAVVQIVPNAKKIKQIGDLSKIEIATAKLFGQRRKMIRGILPNVDWAKLGLVGTERAEELTPETFVKIVKIL